MVQVGPSAIGLVITNLLENAVKFSPRGGRVSVAMTVADGEALVTVADTGPGIAAEELPHLFERFHRGAAARAAGAPGVGLGLAICRALVERQRGRIAAESLPRGGATFRVHLPLAP